MRILGVGRISAEGIEPAVGRFVQCMAVDVVELEVDNLLPSGT